MRLAERQAGLDQRLSAYRDLWHPQPFREVRLGWCETARALAAELLALSDEAAEHLADDGSAALQLVARHFPEAAEMGEFASLPAAAASVLPDYGPRWDWEIPGRKRAQIEAFAAAAAGSGQTLIDWCGGKGHLGRLLALHWQVPATSLDIDPQLCAEGRQLARRAGVAHEFVVADALSAGERLTAGSHAVALHACGDLHRTLVRHAPGRGLAALNIAPCCYYRGVAQWYEPLSGPLATCLTRDDTRLAVTETVTASPRLARRRDLEMAWKLGFVAWRAVLSGESAYRSFKPVPSPWFAGNFADFLLRMAQREGLPPPHAATADEFERFGWRRQREVMRLSVVRHAFRRPLEIWLALDLATFLEKEGYEVGLSTFCPRHLTPRNLMLSARR